jgi:medium-chain acyl-[acyl-carrier-protein] hydrolase
MYAGWGSAFGADVEVCPVQLPGREDRLSEPLAHRMTQLVDGFLADVGGELSTPFAFFGHSMGGVVAYEIARRLQTSGARGPEVLFVSASEPPNSAKDDDKTYRLPDADFVAELRRWNGTPELVLRDPALLTILLPILRADLELLDHYAVPVSPASALACPIVAFGGTRDHDLTREDLCRWRDYTRAAFDLHILEGNHFFINVKATRVQGVIGAELAELAGAAAVAGRRVAAGGGLY